MRYRKWEEQVQLIFHVWATEPNTRKLVVNGGPLRLRAAFLFLFIQALNCRRVLRKFEGLPHIHYSKNYLKNSLTGCPWVVLNTTSLPCRTVWLIHRGTWEIFNRSDIQFALSVSLPMFAINPAFTRVHWVLLDVHSPVQGFDPRRK